MKANTKKLIITIINIVIFIGNAVISFLGNGGDIAEVGAITSGIVTLASLV